MIQDRVGKLFIMVFTNGEPPDKPSVPPRVRSMRDLPPITVHGIIRQVS
jgi:hypothetical protein